MAECMYYIYIARCQNQLKMKCSLFFLITLPSKVFSCHFFLSFRKLASGSYREEKIT